MARGKSVDDAGFHKGDCLAAESPCCGVREGLPAPVGVMGDASHGIFSRNIHVLAGEEGAGKEVRAVSQSKGRNAKSHFRRFPVLEDTRLPPGRSEHLYE